MNPDRPVQILAGPRKEGDVVALARLSEAVRLLAETRSLDELTHIHSMAAAAEEYARAERMGDDAVRYATEIRVRAAGRAGELLKAMAESGERHAGHGKTGGRLGVEADDTQTLGDLGITRDQSSRWQRIAEVPVERFEEAMVAGLGETAVAKLARPRPDLPIGNQKRSWVQPVERLAKVRDALAGYALALGDFQLTAGCAPLLSEIDEQLLALRRHIRRLKEDAQ